MDIVTAMKRSSRIIYSEMPKAKMVPNKKKAKLEKIRKKENC